MSSLIGSILIGILAGFVAGKLMRGGGFGALVNLVVGIIGAVIGGELFSFLGITFTKINPLFADLVTATVGAIILLWIVSLFQRR